MGAIVRSPQLAFDLEQLADDLVRIDADDLAQRQQFDGVDAALAGLEPGHEGLGLAHTAGKLGLPDSGLLAGGDQDFNQPLMALSANAVHSCDLCGDSIYANFGRKDI